MEFVNKGSHSPQEHVNGLLKEYDNLLNFIAARDAVVAHTAMSGFGCDHEMLIKIVCNRSKSQIAHIDRHYRSLPLNKSHTSLNAAVTSETSGNYGRFMKYVTESRGLFLANQVSKAMDGLGCNKHLLNSCFTQSSTEDIMSMRETYENMKGKRLNDVVASELGGEHEKLILFLIQRGRPENPGDPGKAAAQAHELQEMIKKGSAMMGGLKNEAEEAVSKYIASLSPRQCLEIKKVWNSFEKTIKEKFSGALEEAVLQLMEDTESLEAQQLKEAMDGLGTDEETLSRILAGNHKHVAASIAKTYFSKYNTELSTRLKSEVGGHYLQAILAWISGNDATGGLEPTVQFYRKQFSSNSLKADELTAFSDVLNSAIDNAKNCVASLDADLLKKATRGLGTDERAVVNIMCCRTKDQLESIDMLYRQRYGRTLQEYCERELSGDLREFLVYTQMDEDECDAHLLRSAFSGMGCDKNLVVEIVVGRSSPRLAAAREYYQKYYDENLADRIRSELGKDLEHLALKLLAGCRCRANPQPAMNPGFDAHAVAAELYKGGAARWGTDETAFIDIITSHSQAELEAIENAYDSSYGTSLEAAIKSEFSGPLETALLGLLVHPFDFYCKLIKKATDVIGADESTISRVLGSHDKIIVHALAKRYFEKYNEQLVDLLSSELWYDYRNACMTYVRTSDITEGMEDKLAEIEIAATNPPPKPPSKVPERPVPPAPKPVAPPAAPAAEPHHEHHHHAAPAAQSTPAAQPAVLVYAPDPTPVVIVFGVMDVEQTRQHGHGHNDARARRQNQKAAFRLEKKIARLEHKVERMSLRAHHHR